MISAEAWRDAAADVLGKKSTLFRMVRSLARKYDARQPADSGRAEAMGRLREIAYRDEAKSVTVRADDLRAVLEAASPPRRRPRRSRAGDADPPTCPICDQMKLSARCSACGYEDPAPPSQTEEQA